MKHLLLVLFFIVMPSETAHHKTLKRLQSDQKLADKKKDIKKTIQLKNKLLEAIQKKDYETGKDIVLNFKNKKLIDESIIESTVKHGAVNLLADICKRKKQPELEQAVKNNILLLLKKSGNTRLLHLLFINNFLQASDISKNFLTDLKAHYKNNKDHSIIKVFTFYANKEKSSYITQCAICLDEFDFVTSKIILPCSNMHFFHKECIKKYGDSLEKEYRRGLFFEKVELSCPCCREILPAKYQNDRESD